MYNIHVVIPVYNVEKYVEQAVRSVLDQPYKGIDIVLVDDGSPDNSPAICDRLASAYDRIHVIHKANGGVSSARNTGIEYFLEKYDNGYIAFLDADDVWHRSVFKPDILEKIEGYDLIGFSMVYANATLSRFHFGSGYEDKEYSFPCRGNTEWIWKETFGAHLYSIEVLRYFNIRYVEQCRYNEDVIFMNKMMFCVKSVRMLPDIMYIYRANPESITHKEVKSENVQNVLEVATSWYNASSWVESIEEINEAYKSKWKSLCLSLVGQRLLESICAFYEKGYSFKIVSETVESSHLNYYLENLKIQSLSEWQKPYFESYKNNRHALYKSLRLRGRKNRLLKKLLKFGIVRKIKEKRQYRIVGID